MNLMQKVITMKIFTRRLEIKQTSVLADCLSRHKYLGYPSVLSLVITN